jgi:hypothetical protein
VTTDIVSNSSINGPAAETNAQDEVTSSGDSFRLKASSFFAELKRRNVYKVATAYAVGSWLLVQAASIFLPTFDAPLWIMRAVVVFLALGFVLSAILSWIFEITPEGIKRTAKISPDETLGILRQLEAQARQEFVRGYLSALIYAGLGDKAQAIDYLKREYLNHHRVDARDIRIDAMLDRLCGEPRI